MNGRLLIIVLLILSLLPVLPLSAGAEETSSLYVKKVENLPEDFPFM